MLNKDTSAKNGNSFLSGIMAQMRSGIIDNNPVFAQLIGMCPTLAITTSLKNGLGMGLAVTFVLIMSNFFISLVRKIIPSKIRIASYIIIIAGFVSIIEMLINAFSPALSRSLGLYIPLIVVNCIILARAEAFASKNTPLPSVFDGLFTGLGFALALCVVSSVREIIGAGTIFGFNISPSFFHPLTFMIMPAGGFMTLGMIIALIQHFRGRKDGAKQ